MNKSAVAAAVIGAAMFIITGLGQNFDLYNLTEGQSEFISQSAWAVLGVFGIARAKASKA